MSREEAYGQLCAGSDYKDIQFNVQTGGLKATHILHRFDEHLGHHEAYARDLLFSQGHKIILESEMAPEGVKTPDGILNDKICELKVVLGTGKNNIKHKLTEALAQGCEHLVLYYPSPELYSLQAVEDGYRKYDGIIRKERRHDKIAHVWIIVNNAIVVFK